jgi:hypothetical protein
MCIYPIVNVDTLKLYKLLILDEDEEDQVLPSKEYLTPNGILRKCILDHEHDMVHSKAHNRLSWGHFMEGAMCGTLVGHVAPQWCELC